MGRSIDKLGEILRDSLTWGFIGCIFGAAAFSGKLSMVGAVVCLIMAWLCGAVGLAQAKSMTSRIKIGAILVVTIGVFCLGLWVLPTRNIASQGIKTIHDLFKSDCHGDHTVSIETFAPVECNKKPLDGVELMRCGDLEMKSEYFSVYIPESVCTFEIMKLIPKIQREVIDKATPKFTLWYEPPGENKLYWKDMVETGRIYIYHQTEIASPERDRLAAEYKKQGLDLIFRGRNYAITANSPLYRTKDVK